MAVANVNQGFQQQFFTVIMFLNELDEMDDAIIQSMLDTEEDERLRMMLYRFSVRDDVPKINLYCEETLSTYYAYQYREIFRMYPQTINKLVEELAPFYREPQAGGRKSVPLWKQVLLFLSHLAKSHVFRDNGEKFGISMSTAHDIVSRLSHMINDNLGPKYIRWPSENRQRETADYYEQLRSFPGIIGSLDGTHIFIRCPVNYQSDYYDRYQRHSIKLQCVVNELLEIIHYDCGWPGRAHDSRVFRRSDLWFEDRADVSSLFHSDDVHLLGDTGYPLKGYLLTPFKDRGNLTPAQRQFNKVLSQCRSDVERCFGILKSRFKKLKYMDVKEPTTARDLTVSACVLHNFAIAHGDRMDDIDEDDVYDAGNVPPIHEQDALGAQKRQRIMLNLPAQ